MRRYAMEKANEDFISNQIDQNEKDRDYQRLVDIVEMSAHEYPCFAEGDAETALANKMKSQKDIRDRY